ncbi:hypothetical protein C6H65_13590 [Photorhabdus luminescens]|nr:hypothetical protein C6H65_13590 [Photorhabdus luminescens]
MKITTYADALKLLTMQSDKIRAYQNDFVPEEAWRVILSQYGKDVRNFIFGHSFILLKPETIARRLSCQAISYFGETLAFKGVRSLRATKSGSVA